MEQRRRARLTAAEGRRFGTTLGFAFLALSLALSWRGHPRRSLVCAGASVLLLLAVVASPQSLDPVERAWMALSRAISRVTTPITMGIVYFIIITPLAFVRRLVRGKRGAASRSGWQARTPADGRPARMERQF